MAIRKHPWNIEYTMRMKVGGTLEDFRKWQGTKPSTMTRKTIPPRYVELLVTLPAEEIKNILKEHLAWLESRDN